MKRLIIIVIAILWSSSSFGWVKVGSSSVYKYQYDNHTLPTDIVFQSDSRWLLYDAGNGSVVEYDKGKVVKTSSLGGFVGGNCFVAVGDSFYLCDTVHSRLAVLDDKYKETASISGYDKSQKFDPTDVLPLVQDKTKLTVVDNSNHQILKYDTVSSKYERQFGIFGTQLGMFRYPFSLVTDKYDILYITDVLNTRVQMVSSTPRALLTVGDWGVKPGQMYRPKGIAKLDETHYVVSDGWLGVLQVYDTDGNFIGIVTDKSGKIIKYSSPTRLRSFGNLLAVLDPYDHTVEILKIEVIK